MIVMKFGGTSVGTPQRMKALVNLVEGENPKIVVLSALSGTTDILVKISNALHAKQKEEARGLLHDLKSNYYVFINQLFGDVSQENKQEIIQIIDAHFNAIYQFTLDLFTVNEEKTILAQGELMSTNLFFYYLKAIGKKAAFINALDFMRTDKDDEPDYFYISKNLKKELELQPNNNIYITQGYICRNVFGEIDNLKRGGSDYSASLIGAAVLANEIQIWTDIDGMHNNDPRIVKKTKPIRKLSFNEAAELAYFGAKILHPSSIRPAQDKNISVWLKNTLNPSDFGTLITANTEGSEIKAIAAKDGITAIKIRSGRMLLAYGFLRRVFEVFERYKTPIDMITTSEVAVSVTIDNDKQLPHILTELKQYGVVEIDINQCIVCIVGDLLAEKKGTANKIFEPLVQIPIRMISYGGSKNNISILIDQQYKAETLNALNNHLFGL